MSDYSYLFGDAKATAKLVRKKAGGLGEARAAYENNKSNPEALKRYADELNNANMLEEAFEVYNEYVNLSPADQDAYYELALLGKALGDTEQAIEFFKQVVEMAPESPLARSAEYELWGLDGKTKWAKL